MKPKDFILLFFIFAFIFISCFYLHSLTTCSHSIKAPTALFLHIVSHLLKPQALGFTIIKHPQTRGEISYHDINLL
jgi:hypothetical protein